MARAAETNTANKHDALIAEDEEDSESGGECSARPMLLEIGNEKAEELDTRRVWLTQQAEDANLKARQRESSSAARTKEAGTVMQPIPGLVICEVAGGTWNAPRKEPPPHDPTYGRTRLWRQCNSAKVHDAKDERMCPPDGMHVQEDGVHM